MNTSTTRGTKVLKYSSTAFQAALLSCHLTLHQGSSLVGLSPIEHLVSLFAIEHYCSCNSLFSPICSTALRYSNSPLYTHLGGWNKGEIWLCSSTMCSALICLLHYTVVLVSPRQGCGMGLCGGVCQYVVHFAHVLHIVHIVAHSTSFYDMPCSSLTSPRVRYGCSRGGGVAQSLAVRDQVVCGRLSPHNHTTSYTTWNSVWTV